MPLHRPAAAPATRSSGQAGQGLGPVLAADEHHRGDRRLLGVVVLAGVLEDLLHGAGGARAGRRCRRRRSPAARPRGWRCRRTWRSRWRTGWAARGRSARSGRRGLVRAPGSPASTRAGAGDPRVDRGPERRHLGQRSRAPSSSAETSRPAQPGAQVGGLHRPGPAAGGDDERACPSARPSRAASAYAGSPRRSAWPPITPTIRRPGVEPGQRLVDRVVVQGGGQGVVAVRAPAAPRRRRARRGCGA